VTEDIKGRASLEGNDNRYDPGCKTAAGRGHELLLRAPQRQYQALSLFDHILLNGLIQPFQQPGRVVGFSHRQIYPVARPTLRENAHQFQRSVGERTAARNIPIWKRPRAIATNSSLPTSGDGKGIQSQAIFQRLHERRRARSPARHRRLTHTPLDLVSFGQKRLAHLAPVFSARSASRRAVRTSYCSRRSSSATSASFRRRTALETLGERLLETQRRLRLDRLCQRVVDDLDTVRAVGLKAA
jgi:hypothetical protein